VKSVLDAGSGTILGDAVTGGGRSWGLAVLLAGSVLLLAFTTLVAARSGHVTALSL
jgi:hypothetical protein